MSKFTPEEAAAIMAIAQAEAAAERFDHSNILIMPTPRKEPEPPARQRGLDTPLQALIQQAAGDLRAALIAQREEILGWTRKKLAKQRKEIEAVLDGASRLDEQVISLQGDVGDIKRKTIEGDIVDLKSDVAVLRTDIDALKATVEALGNQVAQLSDDVQSIERSGNNVVALRGNSA